MGQADRNGISGISPGSPAPLNSCRLGSLLQSLRRNRMRFPRATPTESGIGGPPVDDQFELSGGTPFKSSASSAQHAAIRKLAFGKLLNYRIRDFNRVFGVDSKS